MAHIPPWMPTYPMTYSMLATVLTYYVKLSCAAPSPGLTLLHVQDLMTENLQPNSGGGTGFGTEHRCIKWQELMDGDGPITLRF
ncbi:hypothetical protein CMEL01_07430 [Colletotrichum melonis]|uniref:Uncharacterized protein n=1 Tax=Colletotrichum melonis TaxID=1209925 RepID=A0AAI9U1U9_9PEZI|nr:hypothetical protein CMEL01_07430 [Colletotrichum melonis]